MVLALVFLMLQSIILTLAPAGRERSWDVALRFGHWPMLLVWLAATWMVHRLLRKRLPDGDPFIFPIATLLSGWGLLIIYRLTPAFGLRQGLWMLVSLGLLALTLRTPHPLGLLRRYKYLLLLGGLLLAALTLILGTNPGGYGPRLWLGCCGIYLQPSEPLKLLLVAYLAAYFSDRQPVSPRLIPNIAPTLILFGLALLILLIQRDLGTASIFISIYAVMLFLATGRRRVVVVTLGGLAVAGVMGYFLVDIIQLRIDVWLNPWRDPAGAAFQVVQSILAIANGGFIGRGLGMGSPGLVPVAHSDFIFASLTEESGALGATGLLILLAIFTLRGLHIALHATSYFNRLLSAGLTAYIGAQSILIVGGNLRLLPLTGVTLPFVSYGGSSLVTAWLTLMALLIISSTEEEEAAPLPNPTPYPWLGGLLLLGFTAAIILTSWWSLWRAPDLLLRTDNARRAIADRYVPRGSLLDRNGQPINITIGETGAFRREYLYPNLSPVIGYTHPVYGQSGLESGLDDYLRGLRGNPDAAIWWNDLLYGTPPQGLDVRLSLDLNLQQVADTLLGADHGAVVLLNAATGEVLAMVSHPSFDANQLNTIGAALNMDESAPLLNRATQGQYSFWNVFEPARGVAFSTRYSMPAGDAAIDFYKKLGVYESPQIPMPVAPVAASPEVNRVKASPLQIALAAATLSNSGMRPAAHIALAVNTPQAGWVILPTPPASGPHFTADQLTNLQYFAIPNTSFWGRAVYEGDGIWAFIGGTLPEWQGTPLAVAVVIEETAPQGTNVTSLTQRAQQIGLQLLQKTTSP